jgi:RNA polymerase-binding transcription factor DksA
MKKEHCYYVVMLDKKKIKEKLEQERDSLLEQMKGMGKLNMETNEWEATPEELDFPEADENDKADRFEDFEARSSVMRTLEPRLNSILKALKSLNKESFGKCIVCKKDIEMARLEVNPAAQTCKKHLEN